MRYHVTYDVELYPEGIETEEISPDHGACTAILVGSLLYPEDGSYSAMFVAKDGRSGGDLGDAEIWKAWVMLAKQLSDSTTLHQHKKELASLVFEAVCAEMQARAAAGK